jgi:hypothetical protein
LERPKRLRRVVLLCATFARNLAYLRAMMPFRDRITARDHDFWMTLSNNSLDMAVLEWCKLFADEKDKHHWSAVVTDPKQFEVALLADLGLSGLEFEDYQKVMRKYRDKFIAHLDSDMVMDVPPMDTAETAGRFYHAYVVEHEADVGDLGGLPASRKALTNYYLQEQKVAEHRYNAGMPAPATT